MKTTFKEQANWKKREVSNITAGASSGHSKMLCSVLKAYTHLTPESDYKTGTIN